jgi:hypothetical protein
VREHGDGNVLQGLVDLGVAPDRDAAADWMHCIIEKATALYGEPVSTEAIVVVALSERET